MIRRGLYSRGTVRVRINFVCPGPFFVSMLLVGERQREEERKKNFGLIARRLNVKVGFSAVSDRDGVGSIHFLWNRGQSTGSSKERSVFWRHGGLKMAVCDSCYR